MITKNLPIKVLNIPCKTMIHSNWKCKRQNILFRSKFRHNIYDFDIENVLEPIKWTKLIEILVCVSGKHKIWSGDICDICHVNRLFWKWAKNASNALSYQARERDTLCITTYCELFSHSLLLPFNTYKHHREPHQNILNEHRIACVFCMLLSNVYSCVGWPH